VVDWLKRAFEVSNARASGLVELQISSYFYKPKGDEMNEALKLRMKEIAASRVRFG